MSFCGTHVNSADADKTPQNAASDLGLHCLLTESSIRILMKMKKYNLTTLKPEMDWLDSITFQIANVHIQGFTRFTESLKNILEQL